MEVKNNKTYFWYQESENPNGGYYEGIEMELKGEDVLNVCHPGANDYEVEELLKKPYVCNQLQHISEERLRGVLYYCSGEELMDNYKTRHDMEMFLLWCIAWGIYEDEAERETREGVAA